MTKMTHLRNSGWKKLGATLAVLGIVFITAGLATYVGNARDYVAVLIVFGGIFLVTGTGLVTIAIFEGKQNNAAEEKTIDP